MWEFGLTDFIQGISVCLKQKETIGKIVIDGLGDCVPVRSGRAGIVVALESLGLKKGARVGVPLYCCPVVFKSIVNAGCQPVFLDIETDEYCISEDSLKEKVAELDALIAVHMFGNMCDMPRLVDAASGKPIIEDCAQSLGSQWNGKPAGSFGRVSIFSFRSGKYISAGEGAVVFSLDAGIIASIVAKVGSLQIPGTVESWEHVCKTYIRSKLRSQPLWGIIGNKLWALYNRRVEFIKKTPITIGRIYPSDFKISIRRMPRLLNMVERQRNNAEYYLRKLHLPKHMMCLEKPGAFYNRFMFPVKFRSAEECDFAAAFLLKRGISTSRPYRDVLIGAPKHYGYKGDCPNAERLLLNTMVIPVHYKLGRRDLEHIANSLNEAWKLIEGR